MGKNEKIDPKAVNFSNFEKTMNIDEKIKEKEKQLNEVSNKCKKHLCLTPLNLGIPPKELFLDEAKKDYAELIKLEKEYLKLCEERYNQKKRKD